MSSQLDRRDRPLRIAQNFWKSFGKNQQNLQNEWAIYKKYKWPTNLYRKFVTFTDCNQADLNWMLSLHTMGGGKSLITSLWARMQNAEKFYRLLLGVRSAWDSGQPWGNVSESLRLFLSSSKCSLNYRHLKPSHPCAQKGRDRRWPRMWAIETIGEGNQGGSIG